MELLGLLVGYVAVAVAVAVFLGRCFAVSDRDVGNVPPEQPAS